MSIAAAIIKKRNFKLNTDGLEEIEENFFPELCVSWELHVRKANSTITIIGWYANTAFVGKKRIS